jgi:hypothetical protein
MVNYGGAISISLNSNRSMLAMTDKDKMEVLKHVKNSGSLNEVIMLICNINGAWYTFVQGRGTHLNL